MTYWITLTVLFVSLIFITLYLLYMFKKKRRKDPPEQDVFVAFIVFFWTVLFFLIPLCIDIPSALRGGEEIYVTELPTRTSWSLTSPYLYMQTDNEALRHLKGCNWNNYEKHGNYLIHYTEFTKFVLDIKKLD
jgi:cbb3-type cytochrome oxidase subunit 3